jgi:lysylphosphatidylglycerol synthetase-like protein (DUF2156 family)
VTDQSPSSTEFAATLQEVTDRASLIVREEIELAKAEISQSLNKLAKGAAIGAAAGVFVLAGLIYFLHALSWLIWKLVRGDGTDNFYLGFLIVAVFLFVLAGLAAFVAYRLVRRGAPPTPTMAIEEAQRVRETITSARSESP